LVCDKQVGPFFDTLKSDSNPVEGYKNFELKILIVHKFAFSQNTSWLVYLLNCFGLFLFLLFLAWLSKYLQPANTLTLW